MDSAHFVKVHNAADRAQMDEFALILSVNDDEDDDESMCVNSSEKWPTPKTMDVGFT